MIKKTICDSVQYLSLFFLMILITNSSCRKSQPAEVDLPYQDIFNLEYGIDSLQKFNLFLPGGRDQNTKVILVIHGGGWVSGDKEYVDYYAKRFSEFGFATISMNYRLANDSVHYRDMLDDIDSMIICISNNASQWGIGSGRLALFGYSAGGHLALLYSYSRDKGRNVGSVVSLAGPTDVQDSLLWETPELYEEIKLMAGDPSPSNWTQANPIHFISVTNPATLLIHGTNDSIVPVSQSLKLREVLETSNIKVNLLLLENETHFFSSGATEQILDETMQFLATNMK